MITRRLTDNQDADFEVLNQILDYLKGTVAPATSSFEDDQGFEYAITGNYLSRSWTLCKRVKSDLIEIEVNPSWHESIIALRFL